MCGIAGMLTLAGGPPPSRPLLERMNEVIRHRGPDSGGFLVDVWGWALRWGWAFPL